MPIIHDWVHFVQLTETFLLKKKNPITQACLKLSLYVNDAHGNAPAALHPSALHLPGMELKDNFPYDPDE